MILLLPQASILTKGPREYRFFISMISSTYLIVSIAPAGLFLFLWRLEKARRIRVEERLVVFEQIIRLDEQIDHTMKWDPHWNVRSETRRLVDERAHLHHTLELIVKRKIPRDSAYIHMLRRSLAAGALP